MAPTYGNICMVLVGFSLWQPFQVIIGGSIFAVKRFGGDPEKSSLFVGRNNQGHVLGVFMGGIITYAVCYIPSTYVPHCYCLLAVWATVIVNVVLFVVYSFSWSKQNIKIYFWGLVIAGVTTGCTDISVTKVEPDSAYFFSLGFGCIGLFVFFFHSIVKKLVAIFNANVDYWVVTCHLFFNVCLSTITAVCWSCLIIPKIICNIHTSVTGDGPSLSNAMLGALVHMIFTYIGHFVLFFHYPMVVPYHLCKHEACHTIVIICMFIDTIAGLTISYLAHTFSSGPWTGYKAWLHLSWFLCLPAIILWFYFVHSLHSPNSKFKNKLKQSSSFGGLVVCSFYLSARSTQHIGFANCFGNTFSFGIQTGMGLTNSGYATSLNFFIALFGLLLAATLGGSHLSLVVEKQSDEDMAKDSKQAPVGTLVSICYWTSATIKDSVKSIPTLFSLDIALLVKDVRYGNGTHL